MESSVDIQRFLILRRNLPVVDVRSPAEFERGHIPGAVNIPLFNNEERALVGWTYTKESRESAFLKGLDITGPKMSDFVKKAAALCNTGALLVYCWRGGMRSGSMSWLFNQAGLSSKTLAGGYRAYRRYGKSCLSETLPLTILGGMTGTGKTDILSEMKKLGAQTINLEELACHKGSAFGGLGKGSQPGTEQFENLLFSAREDLDIRRQVFIEDESKSIGSVNIPDELFRQMKTAKTLVVHLPLDLRIRRLVKEYSGFPPSGLTDSLEKIQKKLGGTRLKKALNALENKEYYTVARIALEYYDKAYETALGKRPEASLLHFHASTDHPATTAREILEMLKENSLS